MLNVLKTVGKIGAYVFATGAGLALSIIGADCAISSIVDLVHGDCAPDCAVPDGAMVDEIVE